MGPNNTKQNVHVIKADSSTLDSTHTAQIFNAVFSDKEIKIAAQVVAIAHSSLQDIPDDKDKQKEFQEAKKNLKKLLDSKSIVIEKSGLNPLNKESMTLKPNATELMDLMLVYGYYQDFSKNDGQKNSIHTAVGLEPMHKVYDDMKLLISQNSNANLSEDEKFSEMMARNVVFRGKPGLFLEQKNEKEHNFDFAVTSNFIKKPDFNVYKIEIPDENSVNKRLRLSFENNTIKTSFDTPQLQQSVNQLQDPKNEANKTFTDLFGKLNEEDQKKVVELDKKIDSLRVDVGKNMHKSKDNMFLHSDMAELKDKFNALTPEGLKKLSDNMLGHNADILYSVATKNVATKNPQFLEDLAKDCERRNKVLAERIRETKVENSAELKNLCLDICAARPNLIKNLDGKDLPGLPYGKEVHEARVGKLFDVMEDMSAKFTDIKSKQESPNLLKMAAKDKTPYVIPTTTSDLNISHTKQMFDSFNKDPKVMELTDAMVKAHKAMHDNPENPDIAKAKFQEAKKALQNKLDGMLIVIEKDDGPIKGKQSMAFTIDKDMGSELLLVHGYYKDYMNQTPNTFGSNNTPELHKMKNICESLNIMINDGVAPGAQIIKDGKEMISKYDDDKFCQALVENCEFGERTDSKNNKTNMQVFHEVPTNNIKKSNFKFVTTDNFINIDEFNSRGEKSLKFVQQGPNILNDGIAITFSEEKGLSSIFRASNVKHALQEYEKPEGKINKEFNSLFGQLTKDDLAKVDIINQNIEELYLQLKNNFISTNDPEIKESIQKDVGELFKTQKLFNSNGIALLEANLQNYAALTLKSLIQAEASDKSHMNFIEHLSNQFNKDEDKQFIKNITGVDNKLTNEELNKVCYEIYNKQNKIMQKLDSPQESICNNYLGDVLKDPNGVNKVIDIIKDYNQNLTQSEHIESTSTILKNLEKLQKGGDNKDIADKIIKDVHALNPNIVYDIKHQPSYKEYSDKESLKQALENNKNSVLEALNAFNTQDEAKNKQKTDLIERLKQALQKEEISTISDQIHSLDPAISTKFNTHEYYKNKVHELRISNLVNKIKSLEKQYVDIVKQQNEMLAKEKKNRRFWQSKPKVPKAAEPMKSTVEKEAPPIKADEGKKQAVPVKPVVEKEATAEAPKRRSVDVSKALGSFKDKLRNLVRVRSKSVGAEPSKDSQEKISSVKPSKDDGQEKIKQAVPNSVKDDVTKDKVDKLTQAVQTAQKQVWKPAKKSSELVKQ